MKSPITKPEFSQPAGDTAVYLFDDWFDPIEAQVRERVRGFTLYAHFNRQWQGPLRPSFICQARALRSRIYADLTWSEIRPSWTTLLCLKHHSVDLGRLHVQSRMPREHHQTTGIRMVRQTLALGRARGFCGTGAGPE